MDQRDVELFIKNINNLRLPEGQYAFNFCWVNFLILIFLTNFFIIVYYIENFQFMKLVTDRLWIYIKNWKKNPHVRYIFYRQSAVIY